VGAPPPGVGGGARPPRARGPGPPGPDHRTAASAGQGDHPEGAVAQLQEMADDPVHPGLVVYADQPAVGEGRAFDTDERGAAADGRVDTRVVVRQGIADEGVHGGSGHRSRSGATARAVAGEDEEAGLVGTEHLGEPVQQRHPGRIAERVGGTLRHDDPDGAGPTPAEAPGQRVGGVAQLLGGPQHPLPGGRRGAVGVVEAVGDGGGGHPCVGRHVGHGRPGPGAAGGVVHGHEAQRSREVLYRFSKSIQNGCPPWIA
jgi:hypothetical protein